MRSIETRFALNNYWQNVVLVYDANRIFFHLHCKVVNGRLILNGSGYNQNFNTEIKQMSGRQYHGYDGAPLRDFCIKTFGRDKIWSALDDQHNAFHIKFLEGKRPYERFKKPLIQLPPIPEPVYGHQSESIAFILTRGSCILAEDMGLGKTLEEMISRRHVKPEVSWYVAPRSALKAVEREHRKWNMPWPTEMMTPQGLVKRIKALEGQEFTPPQWLTLDEASDYKNPTSQRSQAAKIISDAMREYWGDDCFIVLMSGTPAPKSPLDLWMLAEIARPGYLIEGSVNFLRDRLAILVDRDFGGGIHKHIIAWKDREDFCDTCGKSKAEHLPPKTDEFNQTQEDLELFDPPDHEFKPGKNEVKLLYKRLDGLMLVKKKSECTDLPDKRFEVIELEPSHKILQIARTIANTARTAAEALSQLCTLSDGFLYNDTASGVECCPVCKSKKETLDFVLKPQFEGCTLPEYMLTYNNDGEEQYDMEDTGFATFQEYQNHYYEHRMMPCIRCDGKGEVKTYTRTMEEVVTPKDDALRELIERHEEVGRFVTYAAFQGSVDRITKIYQDMGWQTITWDGRGIRCTVPEMDPLDLFQDAKSQYPLVGFIGHPRAAGMGLTLTASPGCCFFSNTFNAVDRLQAADRIHRLSMDVNRGATIYDLFHLPTDRLVHNNLMEKIARQDLTLGLDVDMAKVLESLSK